MPGTPGARTGLASILTGDAATAYRTTINAIRDWLETNATLSSSGLLASRPTSTPGTPGIEGRKFYATDVGLEFRDTGTGWVPVGIGIGQTVGWISLGDMTPEIVLADGRTLSSATYPVLDALIGAAAPAGRTHLWNGGTSPGAGLFRLPDYRGRARVAPDNMGTARGAANLIPNSNRAIGQNGGEERHLLSGPESGVKAHSHTATQTAHHHAFNGATVLTTSGAWANYGSGASVSGTQTQTDDQAPAITVANATAQNADNAHNNMQPYAVENVLVRII
jgi:microcystin-dependent protein